MGGKCSTHFFRRFPKVGHPGVSLKKSFGPKLTGSVTIVSESWFFTAANLPLFLENDFIQ